MQLTGPILALLLFASALFPQAGHPHTVPADTHVAGDVATISDDILVAGSVAGDVTSWSGSITITGQVSGDVVSYAGDVTVAPGGRVGGSLLSLGGRVRATAASAAGQRIEGGAGGRAVGSLVSLFAGDPEGAGVPLPIGRALFSVTIIGALLAICMALLQIWPRRTVAGARALRALPLRSAAVGLLIAVAIVALGAPLGALLTGTLVGIPLAALALLLANLLFLAGLATFTQALAEQLGRTIDRSAATLLLLVALLLPVGLAGLASPLVALLLLYTIASPGVGALLISRTERYSWR